MHGDAAVKYIEQFLKDMNGNAKLTFTDQTVGKWIRKFKKNAVFASASVVVQQPSAMVRAMAYVDPKYFIKSVR